MSNQPPNISNGTRDIPSTGSVQETPMNDIRDDDYFANKRRESNAEEESGLSEEEIEETSDGVA